jgi:hypothetical protein
LADSRIGKGTKRRTSNSPASANDTQSKTSRIPQRIVTALSSLFRLQVPANYRAN